MTLAKLTEVLAQKRKEVEELEAQILREIKPGMYALTRRAGHYEDIPEGEIVRIAVIGDEDVRGLPIRCEFLDESDFDMFRVDDIEILTKETAREVVRNAYIARADAKIAELFPDEEA